MLPRLDLRVAGFAVLVSLLTGLLFGALPAWRARRPNLVDAMRRDGPTATARRPGGQAALVVGQVALTVVLLVAAGLFGRSLMRAVTADPGFTPERVLAFDLSLPDATYPNPESRLAFSKALLERLRALPGVRAAGTAMAIPFAGGGYGEFLSAVPQPQRGDLVLGRVDYVSDGLLRGARRAAAFRPLPDRRRQPPRRPPRRRRQPGGGPAVLPQHRSGRPHDLLQRPVRDRRRHRRRRRSPARSGARAAPLHRPGAQPVHLLDRGRDGRRSGVARARGAAGGSRRRRRRRRGQRPHAGPRDGAVDDRSPAGRLGRRAVRGGGVDAGIARRLRRHGRCGERAASRAVPAHRARRQPQPRHPIGGRRRARPRRRWASSPAASRPPRPAAGCRSLLFEVRPSDPLVFAGAIATIALVAVVASCGPAIRATRLDAIATLRE